MNYEIVANILLSEFYKDFVVEASEEVIKKGITKDIFLIAMDRYQPLNSELIAKENNAIKERIGFRSAYITEYIFFNHNKLFQPYIPLLLESFPATKNGSARRHFTKILNALPLDTYKKYIEFINPIIESCADWITNDKTNVAVKVNAMDLIIKIHHLSDYDQEFIGNLKSLLLIKPTPGIESRARKWS